MPARLPNLSKRQKVFPALFRSDRVNDTGCEAVNAKSMVKVLTFGACKGESIKITAEGVDEKAAVAALIELIEREFDEA
jgi:phosphotransferase system HPr-like phosphotransfer protein